MTTNRQEAATLCTGIDAGSRAVKVVVLNADTREVVARSMRDQGIRQEERAREALALAAEAARVPVKDLGVTVATGYGRTRLDFVSRTITEITCHARGVSHQHPNARTVVDIGGQDSKLLRLENGGRVRDFVMNDRCAAGTGRFLEVVASRLEVSLSELGSLATAATAPSSISSMCVVFAESEIIGLLAAGEEAADIVAGVQHAIAERLVAMAGNLVAPPVYFTGGVSLVPAMREALSSAFDQPVSNATHPQFTGALGAALFAADTAAK